MTTGEALLQVKNGAMATLAASWVDIDDPVKLQIAARKVTP